MKKPGITKLLVGFSFLLLNHTFIFAQDTDQANETAQAVESADASSQQDEVVAVQDEKEPAADAALEVPVNARISSEALLPLTTRAWLSIPNARELVDDFKTTSFGELSEKPEMKPFVDMVTTRFRGFMDEKNVRLGLTLDDIRNVRTGEICFAGIIANSMTQDSHGIVVLVDVNGNVDKANELLVQVGKEMQELGGQKADFQPILDVAVTNWRVPRVKNPNTKFDTYQAICDGWLIATDNQTVLRDVIMRIKNPDTENELGRLAKDEVFQKIQDRIAIEEFDADLRWYIEPFGYVELSQAIADQESVLKVRREDHVRKLRALGFDMLRAVGGIVSINNDDYEVIHRTFAYTAANEIKKEERKTHQRFSISETKTITSFRLNPSSAAMRTAI
ncbi:MAG: hypothetical protein R3C03_03630 [Pirellulaceae bacterium]